MFSEPEPEDNNLEDNLNLEDNPNVEATNMDAACSTQASAHPLHELVKVLKEELGLQGNTTQIVDQACNELCVAKAGLGLKQRAEACHSALLQPKVIGAAAPATDDKYNKGPPQH